MRIEDKILLVWAAEPTAIALVPASKFKVPGNYDKLTTPYVIHFPASPERVQQGYGEMQSIRIWEFYQFSVIAGSYSLAAQIADKIRDVFQGYKSAATYHYLGQFWPGRYEQNLTAGLMVVNYRIVENF